MEQLAHRRDLHRLEARQPAGGEARALHEEDDQEGADDRAPVVAGAAGREGQDDVDGDQRHEHVGGDEGRVVSPQRAGHAQDARADREGLHLEAQDVLAGHGGHLIVVADGAEHAPVRRVAHALQHGQHHGHRRGGEGEEDQVERLRRHAAPPRSGDAGDSVGAVGEPDLVAGGEPHDLGEAQRDDGQVVAAQPRGHQRHHGAGRRGEHQRARHAEHHRHAAALGGQGRDVGAEGEEADEAEVDHAGHAPDEVQAERHAARRSRRTLPSRSGSSPSTRAVYSYRAPQAGRARGGGAGTTRMETASGPPWLGSTSMGGARG